MSTLLFPFHIPLLPARHLQQLLNTPPQIRPTRLKHKPQHLLIHRREYLPQRLLRRPILPLMRPIDLLLHLRYIQTRRRRPRSRQQLPLQRLLCRVRSRMRRQGQGAEWSSAVGDAGRRSRGRFFRIVAPAWSAWAKREGSQARVRRSGGTRHTPHSRLVRCLNWAHLTARALISRGLCTRVRAALKPLLCTVQDF